MGDCQFLSPLPVSESSGNRAVEQAPLKQVITGDPRSEAFRGLEPRRSDSRRSDSRLQHTKRKWPRTLTTDVPGKRGCRLRLPARSGRRQGSARGRRAQTPDPTPRLAQSAATPAAAPAPAFGTSNREDLEHFVLESFRGGHPGRPRSGLILSWLCQVAFPNLLPTAAKPAAFPSPKQPLKTALRLQAGSSPAQGDSPGGSFPPSAGVPPTPCPPALPAAWSLWCGQQQAPGIACCREHSWNVGGLGPAPSAPPGLGTTSLGRCDSAEYRVSVVSLWPQGL